MRLIALLALLPAIALAHEGHEPLPTTGVTVVRDRLLLSPAAAKAIGVKFGKVELADVSESIEAVGTVELPWSQQAYVSTLAGGRIENVLVKPGEAVKANQPLAEIASVEVESLQRTLLQALAERDYAARLLASQQSAGAGVSGKLLLQTETELQQQRANVNGAWQKLRAIGLSSETLKQVCNSGQSIRSIAIRSPIDGVVSAADARSGQIVLPSEHLYHIVDPSKVWVVIKVLEADASKVAAGLPIECQFAGVAKAPFRSKIDHVELRLASDRTLSAKAMLDNSSGVLRPGMFGRVRIQRSSTKTVVCPADALFDDGRTKYALVEQSPGKLRRTPVVVQERNAQHAVIEDGLFPGDRVVTVGSHELAALFAKRNADEVRLATPTAVGFAARGQIELPTDQKTFASAPIEGRVHAIRVHHSQRVQKGQILVELESLTFRTLQLDLLRARSSLRQITKNLARVEQLGDTVARKTLWGLQTDRIKLQQTVERLRRQLSIAGLSDAEIAEIEAIDLTDMPGELPATLPIRAPADGVVCTFDLVPGQVVASQQSLIELHNPTKVWVRSYLFEQDAIGVNAGQRVRVSLAADSAFEAQGRVERLDPVLLSGNRALAIWTELDNPDWKLKEGMAATVLLGLPGLAER